MPELALGLLRLDPARADEAWAAFESAVAAAPNDFFAQFSYGVSRLRHRQSISRALASAILPSRMTLSAYRSR